MHQHHNADMPSITIRDVPQETRDILAARAAANGQSLQEYLLREFNSIAALPTVDELLERAAARSKALGTRLSAEQILAARDADRE
jgi:plasmid stability protein